MTKHLWERLAEAKSRLAPVQSKYRVVFEDPSNPDAPAAILAPDPNWLAAALAGDILPPIEAYLTDQETIAEYEATHGSMEGFSWRDHNPQHPYAEPTGPMTEEEAIEYLVQKDIHPRIWRDYRNNRTILKIVPVEMIPTDRSHRNAWKIQQETQMENSL